jgi:hypothetical protein
MKQLMISLLLILLVVGMSNAQGLSASGFGYIEVGVLGGIDLGEAAFLMADLTPGTSYHVYFDPMNAAWLYVDMLNDPTAPLDADWTPFEVTATPGAAVSINFQFLPTKLLSDLGGTITISYPKAWAGDMDVNTFPFDPYQPYTYQLAYGNDAFAFAPEIIFNIPSAVPPGAVFSGIMIANVAYSGF